MATIETVIRAERLMEVRRQQVDRLQRRVEELEHDNDQLRSLNGLLLKIIRDIWKPVQP